MVFGVGAMRFVIGNFRVTLTTHRCAVLVYVCKGRVSASSLSLVGPSYSGLVRCVVVVEIREFFFRCMCWIDMG